MSANESADRFKFNNELADRFTEDEIFSYLDRAHKEELDWIKMPPLDFSSIDLKQVIIFGGATCRAERAVAWLNSRNIKYPFENG
jgi:hypothetical protein